MPLPSRGSRFELNRRSLYCVGPVLNPQRVVWARLGVQRRFNATPHATACFTERVKSTTAAPLLPMLQVDNCFFVMRNACDTQKLKTERHTTHETLPHVSSLPCTCCIFVGRSAGRISLHTSTSHFTATASSLHSLHHALQPLIPETAFTLLLVAFGARACTASAADVLGLLQIVR